MRLEEYRSNMRRYKRIMWFAGILTVLSVGLAWTCYLEEVVAGTYMAGLYIVCGVSIMVIEKKPKV